MVLILEIAAGIVLGFWIVANWSNLPRYLVLGAKYAFVLAAIIIAIGLFVYAYKSNSDYAVPAGILGVLILMVPVVRYRDGKGQPIFNHWRYALPLIGLIALRALWVIAQKQH